MRLARAEETGDPHANHVARSATAADRLTNLRKGIEDALEIILDLVGDNVLTNLSGESRPVEDLDDAFDLLVGLVGFFGQGELC